jgi:hypothetical protein
LATVDYTSGVTVIPAAWLNDIDAFYYETFGTTGGLACIGDNANANMTVGLTINQLSADNEILAFKSSDVAHGITGETETDTYGWFSKQSATVGGLRMAGATESSIGILMASYVTSETTTKSTAATAAIYLSPALKDGTSSTVMGTDANLVAITNNGTTRFIFDAEGSFHADVESVTFDAHDDLALLNALDMEFQRRQGDPVGKEFAEWLSEQKDTLQRERIVNFYDDDGPRAMLNITRLSMLHTGAIRQLGRGFGDELLKLTSRITTLESQLGHVLPRLAQDHP